MLVKLILISTFCSFVYARSIESSGGLTHSSKFGDPSFDWTMDAESNNKEQQRVIRASTISKTDDTLPQPMEDVLVMNHESMHPAAKHPKKRAMKYDKDDQVDLRPGCCG